MMTRIKFYLAGAGVLALTILAVFLRGISMGKASKAVETLEGRIETTKKAKEVRDELNGMDISDKRKYLDEWLRDYDGQ